MEKQEAIEELRKILKKGNTVYGIVTHVSRSGMSRHIRFYVIKRNRPIWLCGYMSAALGIRQRRGSDLVVAGCGMDMIFATVYELSHALWPNSRRGGYYLKHSSL